ncbi:MAG TPA: hypothetical protein VFP30_08485 [Candidatus Limnocylindria bacterium]|nr:hypothetical protein [Candidatus Limnocylindria bacterium]
MRPSVPKPIRLLIVLATIASLLSLPAAATAAPKGSGVVLEILRLTPAVSPGMDAAFDVFIRNGGKATLNHAVLTTSVTGATVESVPAGCNAATLVCDLGTLSAGDQRTLRFVVGASGSAGSIDIVADLRVDAGGGNPSLDAFTKRGAITVDASSTFFGGWQRAGNALSGGINNGHQSASVNVPPVGFDYPAALTEDTGRVCGQRGIGTALDLMFANGNPVSPFLTVTVTYDAEVRGNRTPGNVSFVHENDGGGCTFLVKGCATAGCFNAFWQGSGPSKKLVIVALLASNGRGKGF